MRFALMAFCRVCVTWPSASVTFQTLPTGLNYPAYAEVIAPAAGLRIQVQNFDYFRQGP